MKVLSSKFEGNPNILLEGVFKKLIISSDCKGGQEKVSEAGKGGLYKSW